MKALIKIINLHFWKSIIGPFFAFGFPVIFIAILGTMLGFAGMFGGLLAISSMSVALTSMPQAIFEFKRSSLLKRIGVTPIKPWMFLVVSSLFYMLVMLVGTLFSVGVGIGIFSGNMSVGKEIVSNFQGAFPALDGSTQGNVAPGPLLSYSLKTLLDNVNWGGFFFSLILSILVGTAAGMFLVSVCKSIIMIQGIGIPLLILSQFLSAQVLPMHMVRGVDAIWYLGYISPFKSTTSLMLQSWNPSILTTNSPNGQWVMDVQQVHDPDKVVSATGWYYTQKVESFNIFNMNSEYTIMLKSGEPKKAFSKAERILNMILPFVWIAGFSLLSLKFFKWSTRG